MKAVLLRGESSEMKLVAERGGQGQDRDTIIENAHKGIPIVLLAKDRIQCYKG